MHNQVKNDIDNSSFKFVNVDELTASKIYYEMTLPDIIKSSFIAILLIIFFVFILVIVLPYNVVIKAKGVIRPSEEISKIIPITSGVLEEKLFVPNQKVLKGEILYALKNDSIKQNIKSIEKRIESLDAEICDKNELLTVIDRYILNNKFDDDQLSVNASIQSFSSKVQQLKASVDKSKIDYERESKLYPGFTSKADLEKYEKIMLDDSLELKNYVFTSKKDVSEKLISLNQSIQNEKSSLLNYQYELEKTIIRASVSGYIDEIQKTVIGDSVLEDTILAKIIPESTENPNIDIYVSSDDIAEIKSGQNFTISFTKYPASEYSRIGGIVFEISKDSQYFDSSSYIVKGKLDQSYFVQKRKKRKIELVNGMNAECKIIARTEPMYIFVLTKLGLINK